MQKKTLAALFAAFAACASARAATLLLLPHKTSGDQAAPVGVGAAKLTGVTHNDLQFDLAFDGSSTGANPPPDGSFFDTPHIGRRGSTNGTRQSLNGSPGLKAANVSGEFGAGAGGTIQVVRGTPAGKTLSASDVTAIGARFRSTPTVSSASGAETIAFFHASTIPEPQQWAMLLAGLATIGFIAARKRQAD